MSEVIKNKLYLGNTVDLNNLNFLQANKITSIICVTDNVIVKPRIKMFATIYKYNVSNTFATDIKQYFNEISSIIETETETKTNSQNNLLICCSTGLNVSATILVAHLMRYYDMNLIDAIRFIQFKRGAIYLGTVFIQQLCDYEFELFGKQSGTIADIKNIIVTRI
jgi:protein-tyrosine phosphatase